ncbi:MAG: flavodoxin family protein [Coriobacteriia bacterium]|nr:flavodoxin family protein [Coriobacteriia bacterium]
MPSALVINGSPRARGRSARVEKLLLGALKAKGVTDISVFRTCDTPVRGCIGCDYCEGAGECVFSDEMGELIGRLLSVGEVYVISPVYFSGPPSQLKAMLDRLQPLFYRRMRIKDAGEPLPDKRPMVLYVVGEGGDPHGFEPVVTCCKSALSLADLRLQHVQSFIGPEAQPNTPEDLFVL